MVWLLQNIGNKLAAMILAASTAISGFVSVIETSVAPPQKTASISDTAVFIQPAKDPFIFVLAAVQATSTVSTSTLAGEKSVTESAPSKTDSAAKTEIPVSTKKAAPPKTPAIAAPNLTAQWFLENTKISFKQIFGGSYAAVFTAALGSQDLTWGAGDAFVGGGTIPKFAFSFFCDPPLGIPQPGSFDQTPFFGARRSYTCTLGFAATSGSDQRTFSKDLKLETEAGQLVITPPSAMNTVLAEETNNGGLVFKNYDSKPVTVTRLNLGVSYTGLNTRNGPLVFQILDPVTESPIFEYHMENIGADPSLPYTNSTTGVEATLSFTIPPADQKLLPVRILGVQRMRMYGTDPTVKITLNSLTTDPSDVKPVLIAAQVTWRCVVALTGYDPNATSGPFATGVACR